MENAYMTQSQNSFYKSMTVHLRAFCSDLNWAQVKIFCVIVTVRPITGKYGMTMTLGHWPIELYYVSPYTYLKPSTRR